MKSKWSKRIVKLGSVTRSRPQNAQNNSKEAVIPYILSAAWSSSSTLKLLRSCERMTSIISRVARSRNRFKFTERRAGTFGILAWLRADLVNRVGFYTIRLCIMFGRFIGAAFGTSAREDGGSHNYNCLHYSKWSYAHSTNSVETI
jgi:hypothetical protein